MSKNIPGKEVINIKLGLGYLDLSNVDEFYFIEDLTIPFMTGFLKFYDRSGAMERAPLTGHEIITITYGDSNDEDNTIVFVIYSMKRVDPTNQFGGSKDTSIELVLVEPMFFSLTLRKYSTSWPQGTLLSDIVKDLCRKVLGVNDVDEFFDWEDSIEKIGDTEGCIPSFYMPYWTTLETIKWIMKRCSGSISKTPGYVFYNSPKGLSFVTLENLFQNEKLDPKEQYSFVSEFAADDFKILSWSLHPIDHQSYIGLMGGHKMGYNHDYRFLMDADNKYETSINKYTLMGKKSLFPLINDTSIRFDMEGDSDITILDNISGHEFIRRYINQMMLIITVRGNEKRYAGGMIDIMWPSSNKEDPYNINLAGYWMVKSITHHFNNNAPYYHQKMTLIKTAYSDSTSEILAPSGKSRQLRGVK